MSYVLRYCSTRRDVWVWYWRRWLDGAWIRQLFVAGAITAWSAITNHLGVTSSLLLLAIAFLAVVTVFAAWPQLAFKPRERTLEVDSIGWSTRIGTKSGAKKWSEVESVRSEQGMVVITSRSGNALLVPTCAFSGPYEQRKFVQDTQAWHNEHAV